MSRSQLWFGGFCLVCFLLLAVTAIPAPFTIDDCNYLSSVAGLRHGSLFLPGTAGLPASRALYAFEPTALTLLGPVTPVPPLVPPLYAFLAYPFSYLGWNGLVFLNVLGCIATLALVYVAARRLAGQERAGWYAAALWFLGASTIEYAQGLWPHMLTIALTTAGLILAALAAANGRNFQAAAAGFLLALAAGTRYQNAVLLTCGLVVLVVWGKARLRAGLAFCLGALPPVLLAALINHARIHSWHPWSKSVSYTTAAVGHHATEGVGRATSPYGEFLIGLWARVVDYSAQPPYPDRAQRYMRKLPAGDMVTLWGVLKKSWLQASPWVLIGLIAIALAWSRRDRLGEFAQKHLRMVAIPVVAVLAVFGLAGIQRHDGLTFNQRYFLELAPLLAVAVAVGLSRLGVRWPWLAAGTALGAASAAVALLAFAGPASYRVQSVLPLLLASATACLWLVSLARPRFGGPAGLGVAACLAWSLAIHLSTDVPASRLARHFNTGRLGLVEDAVPPEYPLAILGAAGPVDAFCPLLLDRDVVVVAGNNVPAQELPPLVDSLLAQRRVLLWLENLPRATLSSLQVRYRVEMITPPMLAEIKNGPPPGPAR